MTRTSFKNLITILCFGGLSLLVACGRAGGGNAGGGNADGNNGGGVQAQVAGVRYVPDLTYARMATENGPMALQLDYWGPQGACTTRRPTVVMLHGGGWTGGSRKGRTWRNLAPDFAAQGWNSISLSYRLVQDQPVVAPEYAAFARANGGDAFENGDAQANAALGAVESTFAALRYIGSMPAEYCVDRSKIILLGSSAGAFTANMTTYSDDELGESGPDPIAVVSFWGVLPFLPLMDGNDTPIFQIQGAADRTTTLAQAEALYARARTTGTSMQLHVFNGAGHGHGEIPVDTARVGGEVLREVMIDWMAQTIASQRPATLRTQNPRP